MNLKIRILYFSDGIGPIGGRMSIASVPVPGVPAAESIERVNGGYLVGWMGKTYVIPDTRVLCAEVERVEEAGDDAPRRGRPPKIAA